MANNRMTKKTMSTLLEIAKLIALSDGNISKEEEQLIRDLPHQISVNTDTVEDSLVRQAEGSTLSLKELVEALTSHEERPPLPDGRDGLTRSFMHIANH